MYPFIVDDKSIGHGLKIQITILADIRLFLCVNFADR